MTLTQTAIEKLTNKGTWVFIPKSMSGVSLPMADLHYEDENGDIQYHSLDTLIECSSQAGNFKPDEFTFNGNEYYAIRYAMYQKDIVLLKEQLKAVGVNIIDTDNTFAFELDFSSFVGSEVFTCSHTEKGKIDLLFKDIEQIKVNNEHTF